jgi:hypothetical protein
MRNINLNQFAFPGMEHLAHPLARHLAEGVKFDFRSSVAHPPRSMDETYDTHERRRAPLAFNPPIYEHELLARTPTSRSLDEPAGYLGELHWRGDAPHRSNYPGEITWVQRHHPPAEGEHEDAGMAWKHRTPGMMGDMFEAAHQLQAGQTTVPLHSTERSAYGEKWSAGVGDPGLRPERGGEAPEVGEDYHPYQRNRNTGEQFKQPKEQGKLKGIRKQAKRAQREARLDEEDRRLNAIQPIRRPQAVATFHNGVRVR